MTTAHLPTPRLSAHVYRAGTGYAWHVALHSASQSPRVAAGLPCASKALAESAAGAALVEARAVYAEWWIEGPAPMGIAR